MSHFLGARIKSLHVDCLHKKHAVLTVELVAKSELRLTGEIGVARDDTQFVELPEEIRVIGPDGKRIPRDAPRVRLVTVGSFNPFHCLADVLPELWPWSTARRAVMKGTRK